MEEFRTAGSKPGRCGASSVVPVEWVSSGNGEGTVSVARSVSAKYPPSI